MASRKQNTKHEVSETFRVVSEITIRDFLQDERASSFEFPNTLTNVERAWIHEYVKTVGLTSKSHGKDSNRKLTVRKRKVKTTKNKTALSVSPKSVETMKEFFRKFPVRKDTSNTQILKAHMKQVGAPDVNMGQLTLGMPQLPTLASNNDLINFRMSLPIWPLRQQIIEMIVRNQVVLVCGETGSGKTTQIPQYILDYTRSTKEKCRIICTQPRRISAITVAERVANERGERTGQTVGFHIRLESCVGPKTSLIYCTNGILLRTLMNGDMCLKSFTHVIVDEVHERDRFSDFLLICLRECLVNYPHLRLILMSATIDLRTFQQYFNNAPVIRIPGRLYSVQEYFLDDILNMIHYESPAMTKIKEKIKKTASSTGTNAEELVISNDITHDLKLEMDECIMDCIHSGTDDSFAQLLQLILSDNVPVDFQHTENGCTGLMAAAMHGNMHIIKQLLNLGANVNLRSNDNYTAFKWAFLKQHIHVAEFLNNYSAYTNPTGAQQTPELLEDKSKQLFELYQRTVSDSIDFDLLIALLYFVHLNKNCCSILVFLPGYDDIVTVKNKVLADSRFSVVPYEIFTLHGLMQIGDQHRVFDPLRNIRKIILSTNIAETSITIDDVVYVIDSGKIKEKCYDAMTGICTLQSSWISQSCAKQRAGRAGRTQPGFCFHLISKYRYNSLQAYQTPEILRMPLHELCLQTKMLAPKGIKIMDFLSRAMECPSILAINIAINHLQEIEALDENEELTVLGQHLVDLPVEPHLAKMLIYSVIFKCLDPVLTIVAFLSYRDPFVLPSQSEQKNTALGLRKHFANNTFSDHMILIRAFQAWQEARIGNEEKKFCNKYFISSATMEMTVNIRSQLLAQLRATGFVKTKPPGDVRDLNVNANNWALVKGVLTAGFYPNIAHVNKHSMQIRTKKEKKIILHVSSSLRTTEGTNINSTNYAQSLMRIPSEWLIYEELSGSGASYIMRAATSISPLTVALFVDETMKNVDPAESSSSESEEASVASLVLNNWILFECSSDLIKFVREIRYKLKCMVSKRISNPVKSSTASDDILLNMISTILLQEDNVIGLYQPPKIGQRPKVIMQNNYPEHAPVASSGSGGRNQKKQDKIAAQILHFNPVYFNDYNRFKPLQYEASKELPKEAVSPKLDYFVQPINQEVLRSLTQNMESVSLQNIHSDYFYSTDGLQNDFHNNGITVDLEGACALEPPQHESALTYYGLPLPQNFFNPNCTKCFVIRAASVKCLEISISKKSWIFSPHTERKLADILRECKNVILIFTIPGSRCFQGIARLLAIRGSEFSHYNLQSSVEWLSRADITFNQLSEIGNLNLTDGQELDFNFGMKLFHMFTNCTPPPFCQVSLDATTIPSAGRPIRKTS